MVFEDVSCLNALKVPLTAMTLEDAIEAIGFGKFQLKIMIILGLSWVRLPWGCKSHSETIVSKITIGAVSLTVKP